MKILHRVTNGEERILLSFKRPVTKVTLLKNEKKPVNNISDDINKMERNGFRCNYDIKTQFTVCVKRDDGK